ncbi:MAG TPA: hypothetical protein VNE00_06200 [Paraburkholderia sp.]|nr:hypothetical protein [Paraburkholderia sp.]
MSAPESNSKGRPSLLTEPTGNAPRDDSRILANLEGRVAPPPQRPKRSRVLPAVVAVLVIALGGWGAWLVKQQRAPEETAKVATVSENVVRKSDAPALAAEASGAATGSATGSATVIAASDGASAAVTAAADASAASASTAATIVADDDAAKDASAAAPVQAASDDASRLSRALSAGTEASGAAPAALATQQHDSAQKSEAVAVKHGAHDRKLASTSRDRHQTASSERNGKDKAATVAHANTRKSTVRHETAKDDSDAYLLAALVARTKPADPKAMNAVAASGPAAAAPAKKVSTSSGTGTQGTLAERINECSQHGFFEEQLCRWRACDGHWGKDPHCPATSAQARQP